MSLLRLDATVALGAMDRHGLPDCWVPIVKRLANAVLIDDVCAGDCAVDEIGLLTVIGVGGKYVMVRRPRAVPSVMSIKDWKKLAEKKSG